MSLQFLREGGAIHTLEEVFPPLAAEGHAALPAAAGAAALQARHFGGSGTRRVALLLTDNFPDDVSLAEVLSVAVLPAVVGITLAVGLPMLRHLTLSVVALQSPAGI